MIIVKLFGLGVFNNMFISLIKNILRENIEILFLFGENTCIIVGLVVRSGGYSMYLCSVGHRQITYQVVS